MPHGPPVATVLVPALNEQDTIREVIERILALPFHKQVIVIDDGSTDGTTQILNEYAGKIDVIRNEFPKGKGAAIRQGLELASGDVVVVQDADLEYKPEELHLLIDPIIQNSSRAVYGSRFTNGMPREMAWPNKLVNRLLVFAVRLLYGKRITDEATCYKAFRTSDLRTMNLICQRFEFCPEVTAKAILMGLQIDEVAISYEPRTKEAGKKIRWTDAPVAFWTLLRHRLWKPTATREP